MSGKGIYDIHCHIVPGVDDGATDIEETGKLLRMEYEQGVRTIIATPHFRFRMFETSAEKVKEQFKLVEKAAAEVASDLHVYLGCEFHTNMEMISMLRENKVMTMAGSRYVLTEFSHNSEENYIRERLSTLLSGGYKPIVARFFSKETINENESIGYWRCSNNYIKFCGRHIGRYKVWKGEL